MKQLGYGKPFTSEALFDGHGKVHVWDLLGRMSAPPFSAVLSCELEAGANVGRHVQQRDPEIIVGLTGEGVVRVDDTPTALTPGTLVYLAHGSVLSIENPASVPLRYLIIKATA